MFASAIVVEGVPSLEEEDSDVEEDDLLLANFISSSLPREVIRPSLTSSKGNPSIVD